MDPKMPIGEAIAQLQREIAERQAALAALKQIFGESSNGAPARRSRSGARKGGLGQTAVEILQATGRPMHGLRELLPELEKRGFKVKHRAGLATTLLRTNLVKRTAPGTFAYTGGGKA